MCLGEVFVGGWGRLGVCRDCVRYCRRSSNLCNWGWCLGYVIGFRRGIGFGGVFGGFLGFYFSFLGIVG